METLYLLLYLLAGVFFGLAAGHVRSRLDFLALGLLAWVIVEIIQAAVRL